jgi:hypothetical protein
MKYLILTIIRHKDVFRGEWGYLTMMAPERIPGMMQSMLHDYVEVFGFHHFFCFSLTAI